MRKFIALLLSVSLLAVAPAQAAVKAGGKCAKVGSTVTAGGKKFTCVKSGGKLVWNKGAKVKKAVDIKVGTCPPKDAADKNLGITQVRASALLTLTEMAAQQCAMDLYWIYRIGQRDDEMFALTRDYRIDRVTVTVMDGLVTGVNLG